jgi:branched-chain amino acid transport system substrate-binding protein
MRGDGIFVFWPSPEVHMSRTGWSAALLTVLLMAACGPVHEGDAGSRADALFEDGRWVEAASAYAAAISADPDDPRVFDWRLNRAAARLMSDEPEAALMAADSLAMNSTGAGRASAILVSARARAALGRWSRCFEALAALDPELLSGDDAETARELAAECASGLSTDQLVSSRTSGWLEPWILAELASRYAAQGDAARAGLVLSELDRLYPGFRERIGLEDPDGRTGESYFALVLPVTGDGSAYASQVHSGVDLRFERARDLYPDLPRLVVFDSGAGPGAIEEIGRRLGEDGDCLAVIGPLTSSETEILGGLAREYGLPILSPSATSGSIDAMGAYVHRLVPASSGEAAAVAEYAVRKAGAQRFAVLHSFSAASVALADQFEAAVLSLGAQVVRTEGFEVDDTDFRPQIQSIRASRPDGVFLPVTAYEAVQIAPQLRYYSVDVPVFGTSGLDDEVVLRLGGEYLEGAVFAVGFGTGSLYPPTASFVFHFRRRFDEDPTILSAQGYDAASVVLEAWSAGAGTREDIERHLSRTSSFDGACGTCTIGAGGDSRVSVPLVTVCEGEIVGVDL